MTTPRRTSRSVESLGVAILWVVYFTLAATSSRYKSPAYDEIPHLMAGVSHLRTGDYRLNSEQGALPQR